MNGNVLNLVLMYYRQTGFAQIHYMIVQILILFQITKMYQLNHTLLNYEGLTIEVTPTEGFG